MKTKKVNPYRKIDTECEDQRYWEKVLSETGSSMNKGSLRDDPEQKMAIRLVLLSGVQEDLELFFGGGSRVLNFEETLEALDQGLSVQ